MFICDMEEGNGRTEDLVDVRDQLPFMRHIRFLVVGSEFALDGEEKDLKIPLFLEPKPESGSCTY